MMIPIFVVRPSIEIPNIRKTCSFQILVGLKTNSNFESENKDATERKAFN